MRINVFITSLAEAIDYMYFPGSAARHAVGLQLYRYHLTVYWS